MIEVSQIAKGYGSHKVLKDISFQADCGECVTLVGKNGCGKTTLLQILAGVLKADSGSVRYFGENVMKKPKLIRKYCGYVPQDNPLLEELSVKDNLCLWAEKKAQDYKQVVEEFEFQDILRMPVRKLSGGMKRRLSIACALMNWPPVLLLDEPTTALDLYYKESIHTWLEKYRSMNGIILMATHDETEILSGDRCLVMWEGTLLELKKSEITIEKIKKIIME